MATFSRNVTVNWEGSLMEGKGEAKAGSGAFTLPVSFPRRIGEAQGHDEPRGADRRGARVVLRDGAQRDRRPKGGSIAKTDVTATVIADKGDSGIKITTSKLTVVAHGLTGIPKEQFAAGRAAKPKRAVPCRTRSAARSRSSSTPRRSRASPFVPPTASPGPRW